MKTRYHVGTLPHSPRAQFSIAGVHFVDSVVRPNPRRDARPYNYDPVRIFGRTVELTDEQYTELCERAVQRDMAHRVYCVATDDPHPGVAIDGQFEWPRPLSETMPSAVEAAPAT